MKRFLPQPFKRHFLPLYINGKQAILAIVVSFPGPIERGLPYNQAQILSYLVLKKKMIGFLPSLQNAKFSECSMQNIFFLRLKKKFSKCQYIKPIAQSDGLGRAPTELSAVSDLTSQVRL